MFLLMNFLIQHNVSFQLKYLLLSISRTDYSVVNATGHTSCFDTLLPSNRASFIQAASSDDRGGEGGEALCRVDKKVVL